MLEIMTWRVINALEVIVKATGVDELLRQNELYEKRIKGESQRGPTGEGWADVPVKKTKQLERLWQN